jgi:hypothetical protein
VTAPTPAGLPFLSKATIRMAERNLGLRRELLIGSFVPTAKARPSWATLTCSLAFSQGTFGGIWPAIGSTNGR